MKKQLLGTTLAISMLYAGTASAVTLLDANDWKINMSGFIESDMVNDSTRSFTETVGNAAVARHGTYNGDNGRTMFSDRNTRLHFDIFAPEQDGWKTRAALEMDFMGYDPNVNSTAASGPTNSESGFSQNPAPRVRHAYFAGEKDGWQILTGQTWSLFGWQPYYFPSILTVSPGPGELYQRDLQTTVIKTFALSESSKLQAGVSLERPSQRDSGMPDLNLGVRYALDSYRAGFATTAGNLKTESMSVGISGSLRQFESPMVAGADFNQKHHTDASAVAFDVLIPLISADNEKDLGNSLTLTGEYTSGKGYANELTNWTGGLSQFPTAGVGVSNNMNLDAGFGGFDTDGNFQLVQLQTMNLSLQYVLPNSWSSFVNAGYMATYSNNVKNLSGAATPGAGIYDRASMDFVNIMHDFTNQIRVGLEYDRMETHYVSDGSKPHNDRYQLTGLFRY